MLIFWLVMILLTLTASCFVLYPFYRDGLVKHNVVSILLFLLIPIATFSLYLHWGNSRQLAEWFAIKDRAFEVKEQIAKLGSRQKIIYTLEQRLQSLPQDAKAAKGWSILAKLYAADNQLPKALSSLQTAHALAPDDVEIMLQLALTQYVINKNHLDNDTRNLLLQILKKEPQQLETINLLALDSYQNKNYDAAIRYWETLLPLFSPESNEGKSLLAMISHTQKERMAQKIYVDVTVKMPHLADRQKMYKYVFIYAVAENGSRAPLAVVRKSVSDLPCTVRLDDTHSMLADHVLSKAKSVVIYARASKSGTALPQQGDLIGKSTALNPTQSHVVKITIDQIVN